MREKADILAEMKMIDLQYKLGPQDTQAIRAIAKIQTELLLDIRRLLQDK